MFKIKTKVTFNYINLQVVFTEQEKQNFENKMKNNEKLKSSLKYLNHNELARNTLNWVK